VKAIALTISGDTISIDLDDGRSISVPLSWYPRLYHANRKEQNNWILVGEGHGIHWPDLDEDVSIQGILEGNQSSESLRSLKKWLRLREENVASE
jgi:hypothetical protein